MNDQNIFTYIQRMVKNLNGAGKGVFSSFFPNISKTAQTNLIKKLSETIVFWSTRKSNKSEHRKKYVFRDINYSTLSVC